MNYKQQGIIEKAKEFFREEIVKNHINNTKKLENPKEFNLNPFLMKYKAYFLMGNDSAESIARALIYPRVLGTSIDTTFGSRLQKFCSKVLDGFASTTSGIDLEFVDQIDGRLKYCQIKAGPTTINRDDVTTIKNHFASVRNLARTNHLDIGLNDLIVGVFYGERSELSANYKTIDEDHPVYIGKEFWHRLTGEEHFYKYLTDAIGEVALEYDGSALIDETIEQLAKNLKDFLN